MKKIQVQKVLRKIFILNFIVIIDKNMVFETVLVDAATSDYPRNPPGHVNRNVDNGNTNPKSVLKSLHISKLGVNG